MLNKKVLSELELIVFDLDGTLLNDDGKIGRESVDLIKELQQRGMSFSFATGRPHSAITKYAKALNLKIPIISLDGTLIKAYPSNEIIYVAHIPEKYVARAIRFADKFFLKIALCHEDAIYFTESNSLIPQLLEKYGAKYKEVDNYDNFLYQTLEIMFAGDYKESLRYVENKMTFPYCLGLSTSFYKSHSHSDIYYLEIRKQGCSKGIGLNRLTKHMNIKMRNTVVMGDWYNDRSLFETKAVKVAMANAVPELKRLADFITKRDNNEDGAAEFLNMVLQSKR